MTIGAKAILAAALVGTLALTNAHAQSIDTRIGTLDFDHRLPTSDTRQKLYDELDFQRAVQGVLWAEPAINNARFLRAMQKAGVPNLGAMIYDQRTHQIFTITRVSVKEGMNEKQGTELLQKIQTYRLSDAANPPVKGFVLMGDPAKGGKAFPMNRPAGLDYWKMFHGIIDAETIEDRDRITLGALAPIGIERGKPFAPDARMQKILVEAELVGRGMMVSRHPLTRMRPSTSIQGVGAGAAAVTPLGNSPFQLGPIRA